MTSNSPSSYSRFPSSFRETFGILKTNGEKYKDIIGAYIDSRIVSINDLHAGFLRPSKNDYIYTIHTDAETFHTIMNENEAHCVISYQRRTTGNFAMVRLYKPELAQHIKKS